MDRLMRNYSEQIIAVCLLLQVLTSPSFQSGERAEIQNLDGRLEIPTTWYLLHLVTWSYFCSVTVATSV